jgi:hypothetical protein
MAHDSGYRLQGSEEKNSFSSEGERGVHGVAVALLQQPPAHPEPDVACVEGFGVQGLLVARV